MSSVMQNSEQLYQTLIKNACCGIVILHPDGRIVETNTYFDNICDSAKDGLNNTHFADLLLPKYRPNFNSLLKNIPSQNDIYLNEVSIRRQDERITSVQIYGNGIKHRDLFYIMLIVNEITQNNKLRRQELLHDRLTATSNLAAGIAHEINNPAAYIYTNLFFINEELDKLKIKLNDEDSIKKFKQLDQVIAKSIKGIERISSVIKNLKGFTRIDEANLTEINIHDLLDATIGILSEEIKSHAKLVLEYQASQPNVLGNLGKLQQMFTHILMNAIQSIEPNHAASNQITISTSNRSDGIMIDITDSGRGIPDATVPLIFDPFFTTRADEGGKGMGLFLCYDIVRSHGGEILINNLSTKGSTISIFLPMRRNIS